MLVAELDATCDDRCVVTIQGYALNEHSMGMLSAGLGAFLLVVA